MSECKPLVYGLCKLWATDYDSPSEMRALRQKFVAAPADILRRHKVRCDAFLVFRLTGVGMCKTLVPPDTRGSVSLSPRAGAQTSAFCSHL